MENQLPLEIVTHIMQFLSVTDRKEASLVNKMWYNASLDPLLQRDTILTLHIPTVMNEPLHGLHKRKCRHLTLHHLDNSVNAKSVIMQSCQYLTGTLQSLSLKGTDITESSFITLLSECHLLSSLDISCCNSLFMSGNLLEKNKDIQKLKLSLKNVKELNMASIRYLSDATFNRMITVCEGLEKLSLSACQILFHNSDEYDRGSTKCAHSSLLTFHNILVFVQTQAVKLVSLDFGKTAINDDSLKKLASVPNLKLQSIYLTSCPDLSDKGIQELCGKQTKLSTINLSQCSQVSDTSVRAMHNLNFLSKIYLDRCRFVTDASVIKFNQKPTLTVVSLSSCYSLTTTGLIAGLCSPTIATLTSLNLSLCPGVNDSFVQCLCSTLTQLNHLDLGSCYDITDKSVQTIAKCLTYLRFLRLAWCKDITDCGLLGFTTSSSNEKQHSKCRCERKHAHPNIQMNVNLEEKPVSVNNISLKAESDATNDETFSVTNLRSLQSLDLSACPNLSDNSLCSVICFRELRSLNLGMCSLVTDQTLISIASNACTIEELALNQCHRITDRGLIVLAEKLRRLTSLNISACDKITDQSIEAFCVKLYRLRHIDVSLCSHVTHEAVETLEHSLRHLHSVQKRLIGGND